MKHLHVCFVIPAFNEGEGIDNFILNINKEFKDSKVLFIVVDDNSTDNTQLKLNRIRNSVNLKIIKNEINLGHGYSLSKGYYAAVEYMVDYVIAVDGDSQFSPKQIYELYKSGQNSHLTIGIRKYNAQKLFYRKVVTFFSKIIFFFFYGKYSRDINSPLRIMTKHFLNDFLRSLNKSALIPNILMTAYATKSHIQTKTFNVEVSRRVGLNSQGTSWGSGSLPSIKFLKFIFKSFNEFVSYRLM